MNSHARRRKVTIGLAFIAEAVADLLEEAMVNGEKGLAATEIAHQVCPGKHYYGVIRGVLHSMQEQGEVINEGNTSKGSWRLTPEA